MKQWLAKKIRAFLGVEIEIERLRNKIIKLENESIDQRNQKTQLVSVIIKLTQRIIQQERLMDHTRSLINVGVDVNLPHYGGSWAVICVDGKSGPILKYMELHVDHAVDLQRMLMQFEKCNVHIDKPRGFPIFNPNDKF